MRSTVHALHEHHRQQVHALEKVSVIVREPATCPSCGLAMKVQKTLRRAGKTLAHGSFQVNEAIYVCPSGCQREGRPVTARSTRLARLLLPRSTVGYDVLVYIGCQRFVHYRQREEIRSELQKKYGIVLSTGEISALSRRFLVYLEALHWQRAPALRAALESDGGWPLHIDATGEDGRGTMVTALAGWRGWVLHAWKAPTERAEFVLPGIRRVAEAFGVPCAIMRDLGRAMTEAAAEFVQSLEKPIPILACHQHFLSDIGEDLLENGHNQLRDLFRETKLLPDLRLLVRQQGRRLGESIGQGRDALAGWLKATDPAHPIPEGVGGITTVRSLAQWILDYRADGSGQGFPYDLPWLDLNGRCLHLLAALQTFRRTPVGDAKVRRALETLQRILHRVECDRFLSVGDALAKRADWFRRLRAALRLEDKEHTVKKLNDVASALKLLTATLRRERPSRGPARDTRQAIDLILTHLERHDPHLSGHVITLPGGGVRLVARTNNDLENLFHTLKHGERRRSGRKILTQDFEVLPPAAALATNLRHPDYVNLVCGSLDHLAETFAQFDAPDRSRSIAARTATNNPTAECASLSTVDKKFVRRPLFEDRILAASQCV